MAHNYEKLNIYQAGLELARAIYKSYKKLPCFPMRDQLIRSAISIPSNIAEGSQRNSEKEFLKFVYYSKGSSAELLTQLRILEVDDEIDSNQLDSFIQRTRQLDKQIQSFINHLKG